jgi:hypothetical protein
LLRESLSDTLAVGVAMKNRIERSWPIVLGIALVVAFTVVSCWADERFGSAGSATPAPAAPATVTPKSALTLR